jgi:hypothetical protein
LASAQTASPVFLGSEATTRTHINGIRILPVSGKPFSGSDSVDWTRTLDDGNIVAMHNDAKLARDSQGRIYRENVTRFPANSGEKSRVEEFIIRDPAAHTETTCKVASRHCNITGYFVAAFIPPKPLGTFNDGNRTIVRESLGNDVIDGLNVVGTRETGVTAAGVEGNSQPLTNVEESWYSPDLEVNLSIARKDPRVGALVIHVVDLQRADPDPALFEVPAGYTVTDTRRSVKPEN